ncbi:MAG: hypothetical protein CV087_02335 [Candidatus Brocadia sp. WS118]|nr:MAG: hypothetical protein CV087_02335 [Candidatus Brocadia sp. WS118]
MKKEPALLTQRGNGEYKQKIIATIKGMRGQKEAAGESTSQTQFQQKKSEILARLRAEVLKTPVQVITPTQQKALDDLVKLRVGIPFNRSYVPQTETKTAELPKIEMTVKERAKAEWDGNANIRSEFTSFASFLAYKKASEAGRTKIIGGRTIR